MARYDKTYKNGEVVAMTRMLQQQAQLLADTLAMLATMLELQPPHDNFNDITIQDRITSMTLSARNLAVESDVLWKRTRR